jgi:hypothetical protein
MSLDPRDSHAIAAREMIQGPSGHITIIWGGKPTLRDIQHLQKYLKLRAKFESEWAAEAACKPSEESCPNEPILPTPDPC